jgi:hypothetical protein
MTSQWPLQLHSDFFDQVIIIVVEKGNSHFFNQSKNPQCVVVMIYTTLNKSCRGRHKTYDQCLH